MARIPFVSAVVTLLAAASVSAQLGHETELFSYRRAIVALQSHAGRMSVEELYRRGLKVREALLSERKGVTVIEGLPVDDFDALKRQLVGFHVNREESIVVSPIPDYFADLARTYGDDADRAFFATLGATRPGGLWPVWSEQQTDYSGCTKFGGGVLLSSYRAWIEFQRTYPKRYRSEVEGYIGAIEFEVGESTCACGDLAAVAQELEAFDKQFPQTRVSDRIRSRISELRDHHSMIRPKCVSG